jgi:hypothetical protein
MDIQECLAINADKLDRTSMVAEVDQRVLARKAARETMMADRVALETRVKELLQPARTEIVDTSDVRMVLLFRERPQLVEELNRARLARARILKKVTDELPRVMKLEERALEAQCNADQLKEAQDRVRLQKLDLEIQMRELVRNQELARVAELAARDHEELVAQATSKWDSCMKAAADVIQAQVFASLCKDIVKVEILEDKAINLEFAFNNRLILKQKEVEAKQGVEASYESLKKVLKVMDQIRTARVEVARVRTAQAQNRVIVGTLAMRVMSQVYEDLNFKAQKELARSEVATKETFKQFAMVARAMSHVRTTAPGRSG